MDFWTLVNGLKTSEIAIQCNGLTMSMRSTKSGGKNPTSKIKNQYFEDQNPNSTNGLGWWFWVGGLNSGIQEFKPPPKPPIYRH